MNVCTLYIYWRQKSMAIHYLFKLWSQLIIWLGTRFLTSVIKSLDDLILLKQSLVIRQILTQAETWQKKSQKVNKRWVFCLFCLPRTSCDVVNKTFVIKSRRKDKKRAKTWGRKTREKGNFFRKHQQRCQFSGNNINFSAAVEFLLLSVSLILL